MAEDNPLEGQDPNEVQGVDPSQSAFQPILNENIPEDLNRTTTTTTKYIPGAPIDNEPQLPPMAQAIQAVYSQYIPKPISDDTTLRNTIEEMLKDSSVSSLSSDEKKLRKIKDRLYKEDPDGEWRDERFDDKINLTKRFPDLFPKYAAYTKGIEDKTLIDGISPDQLINEKFIGPYGQKTFSYLWDASGYGKENVDEYGQTVAYSNNVQEAIQNNDLNKLKLLGDVNQLKVDFPEAKAAIEFIEVTESLKEDLSLEQLEELKKNNPTKAKLIQPYIDKKTLENDPNYDPYGFEGDDGYVSEDDFIRMQNMYQYGFDPGDTPGSDPYDFGRDSENIESEIAFESGTTQEEVKKDRNRLIPQEFFFNEEYQGLEIEDYLSVKFSEDQIKTRDNIIDYRNNQQQLLTDLNKYSTSSVPTEDLVDIYMYGRGEILDSEGRVKPEYVDLDDKIFNIEMSMVSSDPYFKLSDDSYIRNGTSREREDYKRRTILEYADKPMDIIGKTYSQEEINQMFEIAQERFIQDVGEEELELFNYITGATKLEQYNNQYVKDGMISSNPEIENAIVVDDEDATVANLNQLFAGTSFKFRVSNEGSGYDAIEVYTEVDGFELLSSGAIFIDDDKNYFNIVEFMATSLPTAQDKKIVKYYTQEAETYGDEEEFAFYMYMLENPERFDFGGTDAAVNVEYAKRFTDDVLRNSWIPDDKLAIFKALLDNAQAIDYNRESTQEAGILDVFASGFTKGFYQFTMGTLNLFNDLNIEFGDVPEYVYNRELFDKQGNKRSISLAKDLYVKGLKRQNWQTLDKLTREVSGSKVKEAFLNENANDILKTANFLSESIGVTFSVGGPWGASLPKTLAFVAYATNGIEEQMSSRDFEGLTEWEKRTLSLPYGMVIGALERIGFESSIGAYNNTFFGNFARNVINQSVRNLPKNASKELLETTIRNNVKARLIDGTIKIIGGSLSEGFVEGTQEVFDVTAKKTFEALKGIQVFEDIQDLDLYTVDGWMKLKDRVGESAYYGMLGGFGGASGGIALNSVKSGVVNVKNKREFENYYQSISNEELLNNQKMYVLYQMQNGDLTKAQADAELDALDQVYSITTEIPTDLTTNQKRQAYELLIEKKKIEAGIEGKQKNLIKEQTERLEDIDRQLELISKGGYKQDAIQESETKEEVLPDEQSEMGLQDVGQGDTQEQEATKEEAVASIQEENKVREKNNATPIPETDQEISKRQEELTQEKKTLREQGQESIQEVQRKEKINKRKEEEAKQNPYKITTTEIEKKQKEINPENSSNYANLTEDNDGNVVFYHVGDKGYETVKPASGKTKATSREEAGALSKVGGMTMMYTQESDGESMVTGEATYEIKVPKSKVYDFNTDKDNFIEEAKKRHEKENPGKAFDPNTQVAYVTQIAAENGYEVVVSEWDGRTRAQSVNEMQISDVKTKDGNKITKDFKENYQSNKDKGFESVIPANKEDQLDEVYQKIKTEKGKSKEYDETYFLFDAMSRRKNYNQEQITKMINESNLSQEIKDEYNAIMEAKPEQRRSIKTRDNIAGVEIKYPNAQQEQERKEERTKPEYVDEAANKNQEEDIESFQAELEGEFGMLTGENPMGKPLTEQENQQLNEKAEEWLKKKEYKPRRITGKYGQAENSFFVPGLTKEDAIAFAKEFNQESVAHSDGLIYQNGVMNPRNKANDIFYMEEYTPESDFVSVIKTKDGLKTFTVGYDTEKRTMALSKTKGESLNPRSTSRKKEVSKLQQQIDKAKKAIAKILPDVNIVLHKTEDSYRKATGETDSKKQSSRGEYNPKTKTIHINQSKANNRTVAHEVFHAILLDKVKTDKGAKDLTERMIKSLSKNLEGMPEVKKALDEFAANYDENIQNEEKLAELVGILAGNYAQMNKPSQNLIKRFLDRLAKMFGLKTFTDGEVVDLLNTIAGKVAVGEEIADVDIKVISKNKTAEIKEANKRFQADFTDLKSGVTYSFDKNTNEFKKIEQKYITRNKSISDFNNVFMILHQPDSAFSGKISKKLSDGSEILVEGKGGIFYPIKFHEKGYFWASTSKAAQAMAESMNKAINKDGKIYMALTSAPTNKVLSSTNAANGVMNLFISLSKNPKFKITGIESILIKSYNKAFGDNIDSSNNLDEIVKIIEEKLGAEKSSFDDRKTFSTSIIDFVVKSIQRKKSNQDAQNSLADFFGEGMMAEDLITKFKKGSKISKSNLTEAVSQMLTEPILRDGKSKTENGSIYAILEIEGEVEAVDAKSETDHESYPKAIKSKGDSKTTLHLLTDRVKWNNVTIDPATGKTVDKSGKVKSKDPKKKGTLVERWTQIMSPSAGITTEAVKIDTSESKSPAKRKQKDDGPVKPDKDFRNFVDQSEQEIKDSKQKLTVKRVLRKLRKASFDRQNDVKRVVSDFVPNIKKVSKILNAIVTKAGASGYANEIYKQQEKKIFGKLKAEQIKNLEAIIYARRLVAIAENRRERGKKPYIGMNGATEQDAIDNLNMMESILGKEEYNDMIKRTDAYFEQMRKNLEMLRDSGRIDQKTYEKLVNIEYSPIKTLEYLLPKELETDSEINDAVSRLGISKDDIMTLSDKNEKTILFDARYLLMVNTNMAVRRSFENRMLNEFAQGYESISKEDKKSIEEFIKEGPVTKIPSGYRKVEYFVEGKPKYLVVKDEFARRLLDVKRGRFKGEGVVKAMTGGQILRFFATGGNPLFIVGNTAVDFMNIALFSDVYSRFKPLGGINLAYDFVKNFLRKTANTGNYNKIKMEFLEHGGGMDFLSSDGLRMIQEKNIKNKILNRAQKGLAAYARFMSYIGETGEMSFRLAVYEKVKNTEMKKFEKENGRKPEGMELEDIMFEAAAQSRETIDFSQGGTWVKEMDNFMPYFNAAMQGVRKPLDYARKNPVGFAANVLQYGLMAAGIQATSLAMLLRGMSDEEEDEIQDVLDSISPYERANYHIIFTGGKDKDGNWEYYRIKKLPLVSILGTATEQAVTKNLLNSYDISYKVDKESIKKSLELSAPMDPYNMAKRIPTVSAALTYAYNEDTFTGEKIFYEPKEGEVSPYAEGLYSDNVDDIYKVLSPIFGGFSPQRMQKAVEKIITNENTNPSIAVFYMITNGLFDTGNDELKENTDTFQNGIDRVFNTFGKKFKRSTNPNVLKYKKEDRLEKFDKAVATDDYIKRKKIQKDGDNIKKINKEKFREEGTQEEYYDEQEKLDELFAKYNVKEIDKAKYLSYFKRRDLQDQEVFKELADIVYEDNPTVMAARLYSMYGNNYDWEAEEPLLEIFAITDRDGKVLRRGEEIYNKHYRNKSQKQIDKYEAKFGKIR